MREKQERGRPREFDPDVAISAAAKVFWDHGYHSTSVEDLCEATGVLRGSLYGVFGDKHGMLLAALDSYGEQNLARLATSLNAPGPIREVVRSALLYYTKIASELSGRHGCFVTNTAMEMIPDDRAVAMRVEKIFRRMAEMLAAAVARGQALGVFDRELDERAVANYLLCAIQGLRVLGKVSRNEQELAEVVELVMRALT